MRCFAVWRAISGADNLIRTDDPIITNDVLYQLSYVGTWAGCSRILGEFQDVWCGENAHGGGQAALRHVRPMWSACHFRPTLRFGDGGFGATGWGAAALPPAMA